MHGLVYVIDRNKQPKETTFREHFVLDRSLYAVDSILRELETSLLVPYFCRLTINTLFANFVHCVPKITLNPFFQSDLSNAHVISNSLTVFPTSEVLNLRWRISTVTPKSLICCRMLYAGLCRQQVFILVISCSSLLKKWPHQLACSARQTQSSAKLSVPIKVRASTIVSTALLEQQYCKIHKQILCYRVSVQ